MRRGGLEHRFQIQHVGRECGKVRGDGLLVADIDEHAIEKRQDGALSGDGNSRLRGERGDSCGLECDGLATGVRAADDEQTFLAAERERHRHDRAIFAAQFVFEDRMAREFQTQLTRFREFGHGGVEILCEAGAGEDTVECGDGVGGGYQRLAEEPQAFRQLAENADDLGGFVFGKLHELVVGLDGFKRLEEYGLAGGAGAVHHAGDGAAMLGAHRNHETVVAEGDVVFAGFGVSRAQDLLQSFLDGGACVGDAGADAAKRGGGVVADVTVGKNAAANRGQHVAKISERGGAFGEQRKLCSFFAKLRLQPT